MTREEIYKDIEENLGLVPTYMKSIPDSYLEEEWELVNKLELGETHIPNKYKELMGLAVSAATKCPFCAYFHTVTARAYGATDEEIEEAAHFAKLTAGWSAYLHGMQTDIEQFKRELDQIVDYVKQKSGQRQPAGAI